MADGDDRGGKRTPRKKNVVVESNGRAYVKATFNNVIVTLTDQYGNTISWASAGKMGFKGSRKNTPYAAQKAGESAASAGPAGRHAPKPTPHPSPCLHTTP